MPGSKGASTDRLIVAERHLENRVGEPLFETRGVAVLFEKFGSVLRVIHAGECLKL